MSKTGTLTDGFVAGVESKAQMPNLPPDFNWDMIAKKPEGLSEIAIIAKSGPFILVYKYAYMG